MNMKTLGGILLIIGTSIGGGMLALPITAATSGFGYSSLLLFSFWLLMTFCAFLILEVNLWLPQNSNIISMAHSTLGKTGSFFAWLCYLLLFYCLLAAYISSGSDIIGNFISKTGWHSPLWLNACLFVLLLGFIVYKGIQSVDYVNRALMFTKLGAYIALVAVAITYINPQFLNQNNSQYLITSVTVMITSYGFATIVPSLRSYFNDDIKQLRKVILIGSFIPLICYIIWDLAILGSIPTEGSEGLINMLGSGHSTTDLPHALSYYLQNTWITFFSRIFTSVCVATSFLGVALGMSDFLADGLNISKKGQGNIIIYSTTFIPPLIISVFYPNAFIKGLSLGGIFCAILLVLYPCLMVWSGRYIKKIGTGYQVMGGKIALFLVFLSACIIISIGLLHDLNLLNLFHLM
ncbi:MAG: Tyrosine-specific transport protein [Legionellaceae bacterium]